jgi:hypothetical protein
LYISGDVFAVCEHVLVVVLNSLSFSSEIKVVFMLDRYDVSIFVWRIVFKYQLMLMDLIELMQIFKVSKAVSKDVQCSGNGRM